MRISKTQKMVLKVLRLLEAKGKNEPIENTSLYKIVNSQFPVADTNFRTSCHKLVEHGLLYKLRDSNSSRLAFELTSLGRQKADQILEES